MATTTKDSSGNKFIEVKIAGGKLVFALGDGQKIVFDPAECDDDIRRQAEFHGFNQKIKDAAAGFSKEKDFDGAFEAMNTVCESLRARIWNRQGGGAGAGANMMDLAKAIAVIKGCSEEKALNAVEKAKDEDRKTWMKNARVAALVADFRAKRLAEAVKGTEELDIEI